LLAEQFHSLVTMVRIGRRTLLRAAQLVNKNQSEASGHRW